MIVEQTTLEGRYVRLIPLSLSHHARLCEIGLDEDLWRFTRIRLQTPEDMLDYIKTALQGESEGIALPFAIIEKGSGQIVGSSRYHNISKEHRRLEIGYTWVSREWQRTHVNTEAKYLMLKHAFERFSCVRVEFKAVSTNERSCRALTRLGARLEGILRNYMISAHQGALDFALFSIIDSEWPEVKAGLEQKLQRR